MADNRLDIEVRLKDFATAAFGKLDRVVRGFGSGASSVFKGITGSVFSLQGALAGLGVAFTVKGIVDLVKATADEADELRDLSIQLGTTTEFLSELKFAGSQAGVEMGELEIGLRALRKGLGEVAATGTGAALDALERLDVGTRKTALGAGTLEEKFAALARGIRALPESEKVFVASKLFSKGGAKFLQLIADDFDAAQAAARRFGISISKQAGKDADAFNDSLGELGAALKGFRNQAILPLLPELTKLAKGLADGLVENRPAILRFFADVIQGTGAFATTFGKTLEGVVSTVQAVQKSFLFFKIGSAMDELEEAEEVARRAAFALSKAPNALHSGEIFKEAKKTEATVDSLRKSLRGLEKQYLDLDKAQEGAAKLATGDVERGANKAAKKLREIANAQEEIKKASVFDVFKGVEAAFKRGVAFLQSFKDADDRASADWAANAEARADATAEMVDKEIALLEKDRIKILEVQRAADQREKDFNAGLSEGNALQRERAGQWQREHDAVTGAKEAFKGLEDASTEWGIAAAQAVEDVADSIAGNVTDGLMSMIDGTKSAKEAFADMAKGILQDIARIIIQTIVLKTVQKALGGPVGALLERGGVVPGHLQKVRGLSGGDIIHPPGGLFQVGEGRNSEAVVPLPDNRSIPVRFTGKGGGGDRPVMVTQNVTVNVTSRHEKTPEDARFIADVVAAKMAQDPKFREAMAA